MNGSSLFQFPVFQSHVEDANEVIPEMTDEHHTFCGRHEFLEQEYQDGRASRDAIIKAATDVAWIKLTGYALLAGFLGFLGVVFGLFYPALTKLGDRQITLELSLMEVKKVQSHVLSEIARIESDRKEMDRASELDRKEIRQYLETLRRLENQRP
jgi:hypothetical protein